MAIMENQINKKPIYVQLTEILQELIKTEEYQIGDQFLTERAISERYGVSRATSNKALSALVSTGILDFKKGRGTFISSKTASKQDSMMFAHLRSASMRGEPKMTSRTLSVECMRASEMNEYGRNSISVEKEEKIYFVTIVRTVDGDPAVLDYRYVVASRCPKEMFNEENPIDTDWTLLSITSYDESCHIVCLPDKEAAILEMEPQTPVFRVTCIGNNASNEPVWWGQTYLKSENNYALNLHADFSEGLSEGYGKLSFNRKQF